MLYKEEEEEDLSGTMIHVQEQTKALVEKWFNSLICVFCMYIRIAYVRSDGHLHQK